MFGIILIPIVCIILMIYNSISMDMLIEVISFLIWLFGMSVYLLCLKEVKLFLVVSHLYEIEILRFMIDLCTFFAILPGIILFILIIIHIFFG